jgi:hypothetical protein
MNRILLLCVTTAATLGLNACGERSQTAVTKKSDTQAWEASSSAFVAPGWKEGDRSSWEEQLRNRAQSQNDYAKTK